MASTEQTSPIMQGLIELDISEDDDKEKNKDEEKENLNDYVNLEKVKKSLKEIIVNGDLKNTPKNGETKNLRGNGALVEKNQTKPKKTRKPLKIKLRIAQNKIRKKDEKLRNLISSNISIKSKATNSLSPSSNTKSDPKKIEITTAPTGQKLFKCPVCGLIYPWRRKMNVHLRYHNIYAAICGDCGLLTKDRNDLARHNIHKHSSIRPFFCSKCKVNFKQKQHLLRHLQGHNSKPNFKCDICNLFFSRKDSLTVHLKSKIHFSALRSQNLSKNDQKTVRHKQEKKTSKKINSSKKHDINKDVTERFVCPICNAELKSKSVLSVHTRYVHGTKNHVCNICSKRFARRYAVKRHKESVHKLIKKYACPICSSAYFRMDKIKKHIQIKHVTESVQKLMKKILENKQSSEDAIKDKNILKTKSSLKEVKTDNVEKPKNGMKCSICYAKLANISILKRHKRKVHGIDSNLACTICKKIYHDEKSLLAHLQSSHPNNKWKSQAIEMRLQRVKSRLQMGITSIKELKFLRIKITKTNKGNSVFHCPDCPQKFSNVVEIERHFPKHKVNRYVCNLCGYTFARKVIRNQHKIRFHRKHEKPLVEAETSIEETVEEEKGHDDVTNNNYADKPDVEKRDVEITYNVASTSGLQMDFEDVGVGITSGVEEAQKQMVLSPITTNIPDLNANPVFEPNQKEHRSSQHQPQFKPQIDVNVRVKLDKISCNNKGLVTWPPDLEGRNVNHNAALENLKDWEQRGQKRKRSINPKRGQDTYKKQFNVETIEKMEFDVRERVHLFYVKWEGYHHECNTWEPLEHLEGAEDIVSDFLDQRFNEATLKELADKVGLNINEVSDELLISSLAAISGKRNLDEIPTKFVAQRRLLKFLNRQIHSSYVRMVQDCKKALLMYLLVLKREKQTTRLTKWEKIINKMDKSEAYITVENNVDLEPPPENFCYINDYVPTGNIVVPNTPDTYCLCTDCGPGIKSCCGKQEHNAFTYTKSFKMNVNPGNAIFECNKLCKCGPSCRNRVVQHGRKVPLCIFRTDNGRGWGVKVLRKIACGEFVCEYVGEVIDHEEAEKRGKAYDAEGRTYLFDLDFNSRDNLYTVDAAKYGNVSHFINHSCEPNLGVYATWINCQDPNLPKLALFALREVFKGEELTFDYMMNIDEPIVKPKTPEKTGGRQKLDTPEKGALSSQSDRPTCKCSADSCRRYLF